MTTDFVPAKSIIARRDGRQVRPARRRSQGRLVNAQHLRERVDHLAPGIYTADSTDPGYGSLMAALDSGQARFLGEDWIESDVRSVAVEVPADGARPRKNPDDGSFQRRHVRIGDDFYTRALREYDPPTLMLVRELLQNSIDAGARVNAPAKTLIEIKTEDQPDGSQIFTFEDDAGGMSLDILENKFLTIAESGKRGDPGSAGSAGGFGIAKELILFPWLSYEVHTQDNLLRGKKGEYEIGKAPHVDGTVVKLHMPADRRVSDSDVISVVERSHLPLARIRFNGNVVRSDAKVDPANEVGESSFNGRGQMALFYQPKARKTTGFYVRKTVCSPTGDHCGALFMFSKQIDSGIPGCFFLDITGSSLDTMLANRMSLKAPYSYELDSYLRDLVKDKHQATRRKSNAMHRKWVGGARFVPKAEAAGRLAAVMSQFTGATDAFKEATNVAGIAKILEENADRRAREEAGEERPPDSASSVDGPQSGDEPPETEEERKEADSDGGTRPTYTAVPGMAEIAAAVVPEGRPGSIENAVKLMAVEFDFYVHNEIEGCSCAHSRDSHGFDGKGACRADGCDCTKYTGFRVPQRFMPSDKNGRATMSPTLRKISRFWGEVCRAVLISSGKNVKSFGVGWMFDTEYRDGDYRTTEGEYVRVDGENWLLLNPYRGGNIKEGELFKLRNDADLKWIFGIAVHECAHLTYGESGHDEGYARELTEMIAKSADIPKFLRKIRDDVVKRPAGWKPKAKPAPKVKFKEKLEEAVAEAEREFKKDKYVAILYVPSSIDLSRPRWTISAGWGDRGRVIRITRGASDEAVYESPSFSSSNNDEFKAAVGATFTKLRSLIAQEYGPAAIAAEIDEDLESSLRQWEKEAEGELLKSEYAIELSGTTGAGKRVQIDAVRSGGRYDVSLSLSGIYTKSAETKPIKMEGDWHAGAARAIIKSITPALAERWRT